MIKQRVCLRIGTLANLPASPEGMGRRASFSHSPVNVPICFPECSKEVFIAVCCGCRLILIKCSFAEIHLIGHGRDGELEEEEESWPPPRQFADVNPPPPSCYIQPSTAFLQLTNQHASFIYFHLLPAVTLFKHTPWNSCNSIIIIQILFVYCCCCCFEVIISVSHTKKEIST